MIRFLLLVILGGAAGAASRYLVTHFSTDLSSHHGFPFGTLAVNTIGSIMRCGLPKIGQFW